MTNMRVILTIILALTTAPLLAATPSKMNAFPEGERLVYGRIVEAFRRGRADEVGQQRDLLERKYPRSVHLANAYYLSGVLKYQNGLLAEAVRDFGVVTERFPRSNKRAAALFANGVTYEKLNLAPQAESVWKTVITEYPGSQDAGRAAVHLELKKTKR